MIEGNTPPTAAGDRLDHHRPVDLLRPMLPGYGLLQARRGWEGSVLMTEFQDPGVLRLWVYVDRDLTG